MSFFVDISQHVIETSALALVNGQLWDMHRPLEGDCELQFLNFHMRDPYQVTQQ